jgi:hypothetical protein
VLPWDQENIQSGEREGHATLGPTAWSGWVSLWWLVVLFPCVQCRDFPVRIRQVGSTHGQHGLHRSQQHPNTLSDLGSHRDQASTGGAGSLGVRWLRCPGPVAMLRSRSIPRVKPGRGPCCRCLRGISKVTLRLIAQSLLMPIALPWWSQ